MRKGRVTTHVLHKPIPQDALRQGEGLNQGKGGQDPGENGKKHVRKTNLDSPEWDRRGRSLQQWLKRCGKTG